MSDSFAHATEDGYTAGAAFIQVTVVGFDELWSVNFARGNTVYASLLQQARH